MLDGSFLHFAILAAFAGLMTWAAVEDLRRYLLPNIISVAVVVLYPFYVWTAPAPVDWLWSLALGGGALAVGFLLFSRGWIGGGDAKLVAVVALWAGPDQFLRFLLVTALAGGALGIALLTIRRLRRAAPQAAVAGGATQPKSPTKLPLPYGVAIAFGGVTTVFGSLIGG